MKSSTSLTQHRVLLYFTPVLSLLFLLITFSYALAVDIRFGVFTDTHTFYDPVKYPDKYKNAEYKLVPILKKFQAVNRSVGLPFVIHLGDLYEDHAGVGTPAANINYTESYFDQYSCRLLSSDCFDIYLAMGNHDSIMSNSNVERSYIGAYLSHYYLSDDPTFARFDYDFVYNGYRFVIVDSSQNGSNVGGLISPATLTWLNNTLADASSSGQPVLIFLHHRIDDSDGKLGGIANVPMWSPTAHNMRKVINDSSANVMGVFMGHNHINDSRSTEEVKGWPTTPVNNWYKVPLQTEPSRGDMVTEDGIMLSRGTVGGQCNGTGIPGTWDWEEGIFCYSPSAGTPLDHQVDVFGGLDDYAINYYEFLTSSGSKASSPTSGDEAGSIVEVTGTGKTGVVIYGFAEQANYHTQYTAYINENGREKWDPYDANDTYASGSIYDPFPTIKVADKLVSSQDNPATFLIQSGYIRESGVIYLKSGTASAPRRWFCENDAKITNAINVSNSAWNGPNGNGWYTLTLANVGTMSEDNKIVSRFSGNAGSEYPNASPQWDLEGTTLYYNPSSGMPSDHLVEAGIYSSVLQPIAPISYLTISGPCVFYGSRYRGISFYSGTYDNITIDGVITERNGETGVYIDGASFTDSEFRNITSKHNSNYGIHIRGTTNPIFSYLLAYNNDTAGLYTNSDFAGTGASLTVQNATFANNSTGIYLSGTGDTESAAYILKNIIVDSVGSNGVKVTATSATGAITNSYINPNSGTNIWGPLNHSDAVVERVNPDFLNNTANDFSLSVSSPCIDAGKVIPGLTKDIAGNPIDGTPDIGAYEFQTSQDNDGDGYTIINDCNDGNAVINPGAIEICDGVDNNCDGNVDEGFTNADNDGYAICAGDCNDNDPMSYPGAPEVPYDGIDQDCSGTDMTDVDGDGYNSTAADGSDCDDNNPAVNPATNWYADADHDGYGNPSISLQQCNQPIGYVLDNNDCDDTNPEIHLMKIWHPDSDHDNYGNPTIYLQQCSQPPGFIMENTDCDDNDPNIYPGGPPIRIKWAPGYYFSTITDAFSEALDGDTIQIKQDVLTEDISLDLNISIGLEVGYNCDFTSSYATTLNGNVVINDGVLTLSKGILSVQ